MDPDDVARLTGFSVRGIAHTIQAGRPTLKKSHGRPPTLRAHQVDMLKEFITHCRLHQQMTYSELAEALQLRCSADTIQRALKARGYRRHLAMRKPPLSNKARQLCLTFAQEHIN